MPTPKFTLDLPDARLIRAELGSLKGELADRKPRSASERVALVNRTVRLLERLAACYVGTSDYPCQPGTPEYAADRGDDLSKAFLEAYELEQRNLRTDLLSRAAMMVWGDEVSARGWLDGGPVGKKWSSPYWAALDSLEGLRMGLAVLEGANRQLALEEKVTSRERRRNPGKAQGP